MEKLKSVGIDVGSTTVKIVVAEDTEILYSKYERHFSQVRDKALALVREAGDLLRDGPFTVAVSGSAGLGVAESAGIPFVQEVYATGNVVKRLEPDADAVIELGGEDAKIIFFGGSVDERMNGTCAGGTGAFIDQMAVLLNMTVDEMDKASLEHTRIYPIASRCGVFAKSDVQPLLNQGASKADVAASIYQAVVNQTIAGLAQGRKIEGKVLFLGGPLYYCRGLRDRFRETLGLDEKTGLLPEYARFAVALGAALFSQNTEAVTYDALISRLEESARNTPGLSGRLAPLFKNDEEYAAFKSRHDAETVNSIDISQYSGDAWLGIDCGSTTTKMALINDKKEILYSYYSANKGNPVSIVKEQLEKIYSLCGDRIKIRGSAATGYGEELIKNAFRADLGIVETMAHYTAAKYFCPDVDFILDIGGQDIKCFKIKNGAIDSIMLNEACSSGCGSFIETFATSMGYSAADFAKEALKSTAPVDLGSRCTVFMNSSVKQSQKDGATVADISAGLSISVVKNALYKVIRANSPKELGEKIVVQGGTFLNDAVLRAFERETGSDVIRPSVAGLMGAYGAAIASMSFSESHLIGPDELRRFIHKSTSSICNGCTNHCHLTINEFADGRRFISGNQCQKGVGKTDDTGLPNIYEWKRQRFKSLAGVRGKRGTIGLPMALGMYELAPLWHGIFTDLGYETVFSELSTRNTYLKGQFTIPSDTVCYPAKIMHGHIQELIDKKVDAIFYPCLTWNVDEKSGDNHYNCPIVAYYSELLHANMDSLRQTRFLYPYLNIDDRKSLTRTLFKALSAYDSSVTRRETAHAVAVGFDEYEKYHEELRAEARKALKYAEENGRQVMILAGRPYHIDPEICHGIDKLAASLGFVVVSEDSVAGMTGIQPTRVLDQWTFHSRLYRAASFACEHDNVQFVQLVSFGCGLDAVTTDEARAILEGRGKLYTQIKIDEITNLGAVKIRLRSLMSALEDKGRR